MQAAFVVVLAIGLAAIAAGIADAMVFLKDGVLAAAGPPREVLTAATIKDVFGIIARVVEDPTDGTPFCFIRPRGGFERSSPGADRRPAATLGSAFASAPL